MVFLRIGILLLALSAFLLGQIPGVRVYTEPTGPYFYIDEQQFSGQAIQLWPTGSKHLVRVHSIGPRDKIRYEGQEWLTNQGKLSFTGCPPITMTADPDLTYVKCVVKVFYAITLSYYSCSDGSNCRSPGTVFINQIPYKQDNEVYFEAGSEITIEAYPNEGWVFNGWGQLPGANSSINTFVKKFVLNQPQVLRPIFQSARNLQVGFDTVSTGLTLLMDRAAMKAPFTLDWGWNTEHTVGTLPAQRDLNGHLVIFDSWSDGGDINHTYNMPAPGSAPVTLTARFVPGASVTFLTDPPGLKLTVDGRQNWQNYTFAWAAGSSHTVTADALQTDAQGRRYKFISWSNGGSASQQMTVASAPDEVRLTATYAPVSQISLNSTPLGIKLQIDGEDCVTPCSIERSVGVPVAISAPATVQLGEGRRLVFQGWLDGGTVERKLISSATPQSLSANYQSQYRLVLSADPPEGVIWRVQPESPDAYYDAQTAVSVAADTKSGFRFLGWSGDISATASHQAAVAMSAPKSIVALLDRIPFIAPGAIRNAAGPTPDDVLAPGSVVSISGVNLAPFQETSPTTPLKHILAGVTVWLGDKLAPLFFVSPDQINAQLPSDLPEGSQTLTIRSDGKPDAKVSFTVARNAPGLFTQAIGDSLFALAAHADASLVTPDNPAVKGETITLFGTGFGPYVGPTADGFALAEAPNLMLADPIDIVVGDSSVTPLYAGIAAGRVGVNAVRFKVGEGLPDSTNVLVKVSSGGRESNTVMLPVR